MDTKLQDLLQQVEELGKHLKNYTNIQTQPNVQGHLRNYQLIGVNWLISRYENKINCILGDEMGLGKTLQAISVLTYLFENKKNKGPFLIIVPLSTVHNWKREFDKFSPQLEVLVYYGSKSERMEIRKNIIEKIVQQPNPNLDDPELDFNVMITTYEVAMQDREFVSQFKWKYLITDEGHRILNPSSKFYQVMQDLKTNQKLLMSGCIPTTLSEVWTLLNLCNPKIFSDEVQPLFTDAVDKDPQLLLHVMEPFFLRRTKAQVEQM